MQVKMSGDASETLGFCALFLEWSDAMEKRDTLLGNSTRGTVKRHLELLESDFGHGGKQTERKLSYPAVSEALVGRHTKEEEGMDGTATEQCARATMF